MAKQKFFCQCRLAKKTEAGEELLFTWIPQKYAEVGKHLKIKGEDGWRVTHVWETQTEEAVIARERAYKHWREITDV